MIIHEAAQRLQLLQDKSLLKQQAFIAVNGLTQTPA